MHVQHRELGELIMFKRILIAVDASEAAARAADVGAELAGRLHAEVVLLHVIDVTTASTPELPISTPVLDQLRRRGKHLLTRLQRRLNSSARIETMLIESDPVDAILETADNLHTDAIFIGVDNRGKLSHLILGSVGDQIVSRACCPVVTVRDEVPTARPKRRRTTSAARR